MSAEPDKPPCRDALASMYMFLDHELHDAALSDVQAHVDECMPCLEAFEFEADFKTLIASKCREEVPSHLVERIQTSIRVAQADHNQTSGNNGIPPL